MMKRPEGRAPVVALRQSNSCSFVFIRGFSFRAALRSLWLGGEVALALTRFMAVIVAHVGLPDRAARARWLQQTCRRALRIFGIDLRVSGPVPSSGLLVCNHLSYLDILVLAATSPCVFVSKCEVKHWPVFVKGS
jgi:1-acyl-sn-glycerol-3-phosphate acyltransferase